MRLAIRRVCARSTTGNCDGARTLRQLGRLARRLRAHPIPYQVDGERRAARRDRAGRHRLLGRRQHRPASRDRPGRAARRHRAADRGGRRARAVQRIPGPRACAPNLALTAPIMCNDYPTLWNRPARIAVRERQFAARRARLDQRPFRPFTEPAWTSAIPDRGNACIRWPDRHGPVQRTSGPFPDVPVLVTSGDLDANMPTAEGRLAARQFPHARVVEVPNPGHVPEPEPTGCVFRSSPTSSATSASATPAAWQTSRPCRSAQPSAGDRNAGDSRSQRCIPPVTATAVRAATAAAGGRRIRRKERSCHAHARFSPPSGRPECGVRRPFLARSRHERRVTF